MLSGRAFGRVPGRLVVQALNAALRATSVSPRLLTNFECAVPRRDFSKVTDNQATELYFEEIFEQGFATGDPLFDLRNYFYPESEDPVVEQLSSAGSVAEVLETLAEQEKVETQHLTQAVATIHHLQKLANHLGQANHDDEYRNVVVQFNEQLKADPLYEELLDLVHSKVEEFPHNELAFILMGLRKFQEPLCSPVLRDLFIHLQRNMETLDMETLSYLSVGLRPRFYTLDNYRLVWRMAMAQSLPRLQHHLVHCEDPEQLKRIAICFSNMTSIISNRMMDQMKEKVLSMIDNGELSKVEHLPTLSKLVALVVNKSEWHQENGDYVLALTSQFLGKTQFLRPVQVIMLARVLLNFGEPASLYYEVYERLAEIVSTRQFEGNLPMISCIGYIVRMNNNAMPLAEVEAMLEDIINSPHLPDHISEVYDILRSVGVVNEKLIDRFFQKSFEALKGNSYELIRFAIRYTNFHSPYTGQYRNKEFEAKLLDMVKASMSMTSQSSDRKVNWRDLENNKMGVHPNEFAGKVRLLLSFGHELEPSIIDRLEDFFPNMGPEGLHNLSRGLQKFRRQAKNKRHLAKLEERVLEVANDHVAKTLSQSGQNYRLSDSSFLLKTFEHPERPSEKHSYAKVMESVVESVSDSKMSTHSARLISNELAQGKEATLSNVKLIDALVDFVMSKANPREVHISFLFKILFASSKNGHTLPDNFLDVLNYCLIRDIDYFNGLYSLQVARSLCASNHLSKQLARSVFSNEFMRKLDREMELCGSKIPYAKKLRRTLMELNRGVVLRYPDYGVPWFHEKYCIENAPELKQLGKSSRETMEASSFRDELFEQLCALLGGWRFVREDSMSKFSNHIDFEVVFDTNKRPIDLMSNSRAVATGQRIAVQVVPSNGRLSAKQKAASDELELEGWKVVRPDPRVWNSLGLSEKAEKRSYLKALLAADKQNDPEVKMNVGKDEMEEGEVSSSDGEDLGEYTPLQRPTNPKPHSQPPAPTQDYDSDEDPPCLPGVNSGSDSEDDEKNGRPAAKTSRPEGVWGRRGALVVEDGGGETFQRMAQAFQADRDMRGLNKKRKNNVWGSVVQEESIAESIGSFGVGRQLKDLGSDRGAETYDFTLIAKERKEERMKQRLEKAGRKEEGLDSEMDSYWAKRGEDKEEELSNSSDEEKVKPEESMMQEDCNEASEKRGTKRSVKERLGKKKIQMDRFHNETLPAPGEPRQIVDIAEISLVEGSDEDFGEEVAERLKEDKEEMMVELVKAVGRKVVWEFFKDTQKVEREGGMVINNGARRRTPGGVMLHLLRKTERPELKEKLRKFFNDSKKDDQRKILAAKKRKEKNFDKEMEEFLSARKKLSEKKNDEEGEMEEDGVDEEETLAPLPNVLDMIANSMKGEKSVQATSKKATVTRVSSFKEPEAPPNSVERQDRLSPVSREERALLDYDDDDFLAISGDTEDIELF